MAILATIPIVGWVGIAINLGLSTMAAIQLYQLWQQFNEEEGIDIGEDTDVPSESLIQAQTDYSNSNEFAGMAIPEPASVSPSTAPTTTTAPSPAAPSNKPTPQQIERAVATPDSASPTPASSSELGGIDYASYAQTMGQRESGGDYKKVNTLGFVGKYQFGSMALEDLKLVKSGVGAKGNSALDDPSNWTIAGGKESFLNNSSLQEKAMSDYTKMMFKRIKNMGVVDDTTPPGTVAGYLGAAHIGGQGGAADLKAGIVRQDAYGTKTSDYFKLASSTQGTSPSSSVAALTPSSNNGGATLSSGSTAVADGRMSMGSGQSVVVNAPQTNVQQGSSNSGNSGNIPSVVDTDFMRHLVAQLVT
jgi:hypothetical protein